jgi:DNA-binding HxlR family transcriptional regulator
VKRYAQRCAVARALDVIGERWTPLIIRELLLGPKRYTDLQEALPGVGTNILADRLASLQEHGVITRRTLPPPTPVAVYELTEAGAALAPVLRELRRWGRQFGPAPKPGDAVRPGWVIQGAASQGRGLEPGQVCELRVGAEVFELTADENEVSVKARPAAVTPTTTLTIEPKLLAGLASGRINTERGQAEIDVDGDHGVADHVIAMLAGSAQ